MTTFSIKEIFTQGWNLFKEKPWTYIGITLTLTVFSMVVNALTGDGKGLIAIIGFLIGLAASTVVSIAYSRMALSVTAREDMSWDKLWAPEHFWNMLGTTILQGIVILVGLVLLIIPGIYAALVLSMSQLVVVDKKLAPVAALKESYRLTKGHVWQLLFFMLAILVLNIVGVLALFVGLFVTIPITIIAVACVYRKLMSLQGMPLTTEAPTATPPAA